MIDFTTSDPLPIAEGDTIEIMTDICTGSIICIELLSNSVFGIRELSPEEAVAYPHKKYLVNKGDTPGTISLTCEY